MTSCTTASGVGMPERRARRSSPASTAAAFQGTAGFGNFTRKSVRRSRTTVLRMVPPNVPPWASSSRRHAAARASGWLDGALNLSAAASSSGSSVSALKYRSGFGGVALGADFG